MVVPVPVTTVDPRQANHPSIQRKFRPDIEGLRAIAVIMVMLDHAGLAWLSGGYIGVDVFFVLSGFLITTLLLKEVHNDGGISLVQFYARRARRLFPAAALVLVVTVLASYYVFGEMRANRTAEDARWAALFASNFRFIEQGTDYLGAQQPPSPLQHFWSLAVEEQFYVVWPLLMMLVAAVGRRIPLRLKLGVVLSVMIAGSLLWSIELTALDATRAYFSPFPRASELAAGALLAVVAPALVTVPRRVGVLASWLGVGIVIASALLFDANTPFPGSAMMLPVLGAVLAVAGGSIAPEGGAEVMLARKPFQWVGKLSYSLYLWHWPVILIAAGWAGRELTVTENLLLYIPAVALSAATFVIVEDPIRASSFLKRRPPLVSVGVGAALVMMTVGTASAMISTHKLEGEVVNDNVHIEIPSAHGVVRAVVDGTSVETWPDQPPRIENVAYSDKCDVTRLDTSATICVHGDSDALRTAVIYGDSHAAMWIPAFDRIGKEEGWRIVQIDKPGCIVPDFPNYSKSLGREYTECAEFRQWALGQIEEIQPDVVIMTSARKGVIRSDDGEPTEDGLDEVWASGLDVMLDRIAPMTGRIVVLGDMAYPEEAGIDCLTEHKDDVQACSTPRDDAVLADHNAMVERIVTEHGAEFVDVVPWFCTEDVCPAVIGGLTVHRDSMHINENFAVFLSSALAEATGLAGER